MSLVGPRPLFKEDTEKYDANYMRRLNVLPGIIDCYKLVTEMPQSLRHGINMILNTLKIGL